MALSKFPLFLLQRADFHRVLKDDANVGMVLPNHHVHFDRVLHVAIFHHFFGKNTLEHFKGFDAHQALPLRLPQAQWACVATELRMLSTKASKSTTCTRVESKIENQLRSSGLC